MKCVSLLPLLCHSPLLRSSATGECMQVDHAHAHRDGGCQAKPTKNGHQNTVQHTTHSDKGSGQENTLLLTDWSFECVRAPFVCVCVSSHLLTPCVPPLHSIIPGTAWLLVTCGRSRDARRYECHLQVPSCLLFVSMPHDSPRFGWYHSSLEVASNSGFDDESPCSRC